ncbi:hypothetical protein HPB47_012159, partial [Ixodes persulcatus]
RTPRPYNIGGQQQFCRPKQRRVRAKTGGTGQQSRRRTHEDGQSVPDTLCLWLDQLDFDCDWRGLAEDGIGSGIGEMLTLSAVPVCILSLPTGSRSRRATRASSLAGLPRDTTGYRHHVHPLRTEIAPRKKQKIRGYVQGLDYQAENNAGKGEIRRRRREGPSVNPHKRAVGAMGPKSVKWRGAKRKRKYLALNFLSTRRRRPADEDSGCVTSDGNSESQRARSEEEATLGDSDVSAERSGRAKRTDRAVQASLGKRTDPGFAARGSSSPEQQLPETVTAAAGQVESVGHSKSTQTAEEDVSRSAGGTEDASEDAAVTEDASDISGKIEEVGETQRLGSHVEDVATLCEDEVRSTVLLETCAGVVYPKKPKRYVYGSRKYKKGPVNNFKKSMKAQSPCGGAAIGIAHAQTVHLTRSLRMYRAHTSCGNCAFSHTSRFRQKLQKPAGSSQGIGHLDAVAGCRHVFVDLAYDCAKKGFRMYRFPQGKENRAMHKIREAKMKRATWVHQLLHRGFYHAAVETLLSGALLTTVLSASTAAG